MSKRDPAKVDRYQDAVARIARLQPGTPEYQRNADIIRSIGQEYGFNWQDKIGAAAAPSPAAKAAAAGATTAPAPAADTRDPARVERYQEAVKRIQGLQPGTPEYQKNADIIKTIGQEYGFHWQDKADFNAVVAPPPAPVVTPAPVVDTGPVPPPPQQDTLTPDGNINQAATAERLAAQREQDIQRQFKLDNPDQVDQYGNTITFTRGPNGEVIRTIKQGDTARKFMDLATAAASSFNGEGDRRAAEEATYGTLTKYYDRDMARELENQKQELANRGIPYDPAAAQDPNSKNLYGRTIGGITEKYRGLKDTAAQQAVIAGNQAYATTSSARDSFLNAVMAGSNLYGADFGNYVNSIQSKLGDDTLSILSMSADQYAKMKGISVQEAQAAQDRALEEKKLKEAARANKASEAIARAAAAKAGGGGGGGGGGASAGGGFDI